MCRCDEYEDLLESMSTWIAGKTWGGHEADCPAFAGATGECSCIEAVRVEWHKTRKLRELEKSQFKRELQALAPRMMDLQAENDRLRAENSRLWAEKGAYLFLSK